MNIHEIVIVRSCLPVRRFLQIQMLAKANSCGSMIDCDFYLGNVTLINNV